MEYAALVAMILVTSATNASVDLTGDQGENLENLIDKLIREHLGSKRGDDVDDLRKSLRLLDEVVRSKEHRDKGLEDLLGTDVPTDYKFSVYSDKLFERVLGVRPKIFEDLDYTMALIGVRNKLENVQVEGLDLPKFFSKKPGWSIFG